MGIQKASARRVRQELINQKFVFVYFPSSNCIFMTLQGNDILVNCQGNKFIQRTYIYSQKVCSFEANIFVHGVIFISKNLSAHSMKYLPSRKTYSFREIISI